MQFSPTYRPLVPSPTHKKRPDIINSLPNNRMLDRSNIKAPADDKIDKTEKLKFILASVENIVVKRENAGYQHFLLFPQCFLFQRC